MPLQLPELYGHPTLKMAKIIQENNSVLGRNSGEIQMREKKRGNRISNGRVAEN